MKRKILASVLSVMMVLSCFSTAFAVEKCDDCWANPSFKYVDNGNGTHNVVCNVCGTVDSTSQCVWESGECACGSTEPCDHMANGWTYENNGDGTHKTICNKCGETVTAAAPCVWTDGDCVCGSTKPCDHTGNHWKYEDNGNGTHNVVCTDCGETVTVATSCVWENGKACICGSTCDHMSNSWTYTDNHDGTHRVDCAVCGKTVTEKADCVWDDGACICGSIKCDHMKNNWEYDYNYDGTHKVICADCGTVVTESTDCVWESGECVCGSTAPTSCDHMNNNWTYVDNGDGTHDVICADCNETVTKGAACVWESGKCVCGSTACDHMGNHWTYTYNGDGTHKVICADCGTVVTESADCVWESGACACGSTDPNDCDHMENHWKYVYNGDGTHKVICKDCGITVTESTPCVWESGKCVCGSVKHSGGVVVDPSNPTTPTNPTTPSKPSTGCPKDSTCPISKFTDASATAWYHDGVHYVLENGLMVGISDTQFAPNATLTRAELAQILYNKAGKPAVSGSSTFTDVPASAWYAKAITWAQKNNVVSGIGGNKFAPNQTITREQIAVMLHNDAGKTAVTGTLNFKDAADVSDWAKDAMIWATQNKVINGAAQSDGTLLLNAKSGASRAETAAMLANYYNK